MPVDMGAGLGLLTAVINLELQVTWFVRLTHVMCCQGRRFIRFPAAVNVALAVVMYWLSSRLINHRSESRQLSPSTNHRGTIIHFQLFHLEMFFFRIFKLQQLVSGCKKPTEATQVLAFRRHYRLLVFLGRCGCMQLWSLLRTRFVLTVNWSWHVQFIVILSWLHPSMSQESKLLFADPHIHHIIHIGEPIEFQTCINEQFFDLLVSCGFEYTRIPVKTISQPDYFVEDELHKRLWEKGQVMCRSEVMKCSNTCLPTARIVVTLSLIYGWKWHSWKCRSWLLFVYSCYFLLNVYKLMHSSLTTVDTAFFASAKLLRRSGAKGVRSVAGISTREVGRWGGTIFLVPGTIFTPSVSFVETHTRKLNGVLIHYSIPLIRSFAS